MRLATAIPTQRAPGIPSMRKLKVAATNRVLHWLQMAVHMDPRMKIVGASLVTLSIVAGDMFIRHRRRVVPRRPTAVPQKPESIVEVYIAWDIENMPLPSNMSVLEVYQ